MSFVLTLAQTSSGSGGGTGSAIGAMIILLIQLAIVVLIVAAFWKIFVKAGQPGWAAIVPIYNLYILCKITGRPAWWLILFLIPFVNIIASIILSLDVAKAFNKGTGFAVGLILLGFVFYPILGFGSAQYRGPARALP